MLAGRCHSQTARPSKRRSWLDGLLLLQGDRPTSKMDASIPEPTPWPTSPWGKTALFNNRPRREEIARRQFLFFGKSVAKFTIKLAAGRPKKIRQIPPRNAVYSMPALRKCPFAPLDKWPAEPLFEVEVPLVQGKKGAFWNKE